MGGGRAHEKNNRPINKCYVVIQFIYTVEFRSRRNWRNCGSNSGIFFTDHPISISIDGVKYYYLYDGLGSVTELIDESENVVNTYRYDPFGNSIGKTETVYNPHQYTGRQYDEESGLYHYRTRAYSPEIGRFMQQDPIGMADGANMYVYVGNNPVNGVDPSGLFNSGNMYANLGNDPLEDNDFLDEEESYWRLPFTPGDIKDVAQKAFESAFMGVYNWLDENIDKRGLLVSVIRFLVEKDIWYI